MAVKWCHLWPILCVLVASLSRTIMGQTCAHPSNGAKDPTWARILSNTTAKPPDGIGFLGRGFDLYQGNLLSSDGAVGFRLPVLELDYKMNKHTLDGAYLIPDKVDLLQIIQSTPKGSSSYTEIRTPPDFLRLMSRMIKVHGQPSLADGRFQASKAYQELLVSAGEGTVLYNIDEKRFHRASLEGNSQTATKYFVESFNQLPQECNPASRPQYMDFLAAYGTHIATQVILGQMLVTKKPFDTLDVLLAKKHGSSMQEIFQTKPMDGQSNMQWQDLENKAIPVEVRLEPLQNVITSSFLGLSSVSDIVPRRDCLIETINHYCRASTNQLCQEEGSSKPLRYGDNITFFKSEGKELSIQKDFTSIAGGVVGFPFSLSSAKSSGQMSLMIVPTSGQGGRLGDPIMYGDVFGLSSPKNPEQRAEISLRTRVQYFDTQESMIEGEPLFRDITSISSQYGPMMYIPNDGVKYIDLTFETSKSGNLVSEAGPWFFTLSMSSTSRQFIIDPCVNSCLPGSIITTTVSLPIDSTDIQKITLKPLPQWSEQGTRPGTWSVQSIRLLDAKLSMKYEIGQFTISSDPSSCGHCANGEWTNKNGLTSSGLMLGSIVFFMDAEYYFSRAKALNDGSVVASNKSSVILHTRGLGIQEKATGSCIDLYCQHNGQCIEKPGEKARCRCTVEWTGPTCTNPCMSEILTIRRSKTNPPRVYGSTGQLSNTSLEWSFASSQGNNFVVIPLNDVYKVSVIEMAQSMDISRITVEIFNTDGQEWMETNTKSLSGGSRTYLLSLKSNDGFALLDKIKITYRGATLPLEGFKIYGCLEKSVYVDLPNILSSGTLALFNTPGGVNKNLNGETKQSLNAQSPIISENISFLINSNQSSQCDTGSEGVRWAVARQFQLCPSMISINKIQTETDLNDLKTVHVELTITGEEDSVLPAKNLADTLIASEQLSLDCTSAGVDVQEVQDIVSAAEIRLIVVMAVLLFLVLICLILFIIFLIRLSHKYRDIHNELTTIRKLKMQKRIAKRQEVHPHPHVPYHSFTLPRPNSAGSSSATTSIPGRNGLPRTLRYSQSLHGQNDRNRNNNHHSSLTGRGPIDPSNYIISNPSPVVRTPSPGGTKSGEDSDTVQSMC